MAYYLPLFFQESFRDDLRAALQDLGPAPLPRDELVERLVADYGFDRGNVLEALRVDEALASWRP